MRFVSYLFFTGQRKKLTPDEAKILESGDPFSLEVGDKTIQGWRWGNGPAVVITHGWGASVTYMTSFIDPLVKAGLSPILYDNPAHGLSSGRTTNFLELLATAEAVTAMAGDVVGVIGHSMGAAASVNLRRADGRPLRYCLVAPMYDLPANVNLFGQALGIHPPLYQAAIDNIEQEHGRTLRECSPSTLAPGMTAPALIVNDEEDRSTTVAEARKFCAAWPGAHLMITTGLGHNRILHDPDVVDRAVRFIADGR